MSAPNRAPPPWCDGWYMVIVFNGVFCPRCRKRLEAKR